MSEESRETMKSSCPCGYGLDIRNRNLAFSVSSYLRSPRPLQLWRSLLPRPRVSTAIVARPAAHPRVWCSQPRAMTLSLVDLWRQSPHKSVDIASVPSVLRGELGGYEMGLVVRPFGITPSRDVRTMPPPNSKSWTAKERNSSVRSERPWLWLSCLSMRGSSWSKWKNPSSRSY